MLCASNYPTRPSPLEAGTPGGVETPYSAVLRTLFHALFDFDLPPSFRDRQTEENNRAVSASGFHRLKTCLSARSRRWCGWSIRNQPEIRNTTSQGRPRGCCTSAPSSRPTTIPPKLNPFRQDPTHPLPTNETPHPCPPTILTSWLNILAWLLAPCDSSGLKICWPYIEAGGISMDSHNRDVQLAQVDFPPERPLSRWARVQSEQLHRRK